MEKVFVIKIGGNIIDDEVKLAAFLQEFAGIFGSSASTPHKPLGILVHGGGKLATRLAAELGIQQQLVDGRRITDAETLKIVTMVYAGYINKNMVAQLQSYNCNAIGLSGADGNIIQAHKRVHASIDYGFVGDVDSVDVSFIQSLLNRQLSVVLAPVTHDKQGQLLNTNADTIAQETAKALTGIYDVQLVYSFEKSGVLLDVADEASVIPVLNYTYYQQLKTPQPGSGEPKIFAGMIPKLDNAFAALNSGVQKVIIGKAEQLHQLINGTAGTTIVHE